MDMLLLAGHVYAQDLDDIANMDDIAWTSIVFNFSFFWRNVSCYEGRWKGIPNFGPSHCNCMFDLASIILSPGQEPLTCIFDDEVIMFKTKLGTLLQHLNAAVATS